MKKSKFYVVFSILAVLFGIGALVYAVYAAATGKSNGFRLIKRALVIFGAACVFAGAVTSTQLKNPMKEEYAKKYKDIMGNAFADRKFLHFLYVNAVRNYTNNLYEPAIKVLNNLGGKCKTVEEETAVLFFLALCYEETDEVDEAIDTYEDLLHSDSSHSFSWTNLGELYLKKGKIKEAENAFDRAIQTDPYNPYVWLKLGHNYSKLKNLSKAVDCYQKSYVNDNNYLPAIANLAITYGYSGDKANSEYFKNLYIEKGGDKAFIERSVAASDIVGKNMK